jgi:hypothetical protein
VGEIGVLKDKLEESTGLRMTISKRFPSKNEIATFPHLHHPGSLQVFKAIKSIKNRAEHQEKHDRRRRAHSL